MYIKKCILEFYIEYNYFKIKNIISSFYISYVTVLAVFFKIFFN